MHSINSAKYSIQCIEIPHYLQLFSNIPVNYNAWYSNTIKDSIQFIQTSNNMAGQYDRGTKSLVTILTCAIK